MTIYTEQLENDLVFCYSGKIAWVNTYVNDNMFESTDYKEDKFILYFNAERL